MCWTLVRRSRFLTDLCGCSIAIVTLIAGCGQPHVDGDSQDQPPLTAIEVAPLLLSESKQRETIPLLFEFSNPFDVPVKLSATDKSCTCFDVELPEGAISPGGSATLNAIRKSPKRSGPQHVNFTLAVADADSGKELERYDAAGTFVVLEDEELDPPKLVVSFDDAEEKSRQITFDYVSRLPADSRFDFPEELEVTKLPPEIKVVEIGAASLRTENGVREMRRSITLEVENAPRLVEGVGGWINVDVGEQESRLSAHYTLARRSGIEAVPKQLWFSAVPVGTEAKRKVHLRGRGSHTQEFAIESWESTAEAFAVRESSWDAKTSSVHVDIVFTPPAAGKHEGSIRLKPTRGSEQPIIVKLIGMATEPKSAAQPSGRGDSETR